MEQILTAYYKDNAKRLRRVVDGILQKFGGLSDKDHDDFYSLANEVFVEAMRRYDDSASFDAFLYVCLTNKVKTEITRRNRDKRKADRIAVSIDTPIGDDEGSTIGDMIVDDFTIEKEVFEKEGAGYSPRMLSYLSRLSSLQREVLRLDTAGFSPDEIKNELHISEKQYADCCEAIHSYRNVSVLISAM